MPFSLYHAQLRCLWSASYLTFCSFSNTHHLGVRTAATASAWTPTRVQLPASVSCVQRA
jgi:hypothetical protein